MPATFYSITQQEMTDFLVGLGFKQLDLPNVHELTFGKVFTYGEAPNVVKLSMRIYTSINKPFNLVNVQNPLFSNSGRSRAKGTDAIRLQFFWRKYDGFEPLLVGETVKCLRVVTWQANIKKAIDKLSKQQIVPCPKCNAPMTKRKGKFGKFWGCATWKNTKCDGKRDYSA